MENKILPVDIIKIEVEEEKVETSEMGSFGVDQVTWELGVENNYYESAETVSNSIKTEYNNCDTSSMEYGPTDNRVLVLSAEKIKSEKDLEDNNFDVIAKPEEVIIKHETHSDIFVDANTEAVSDSTLQGQMLRKCHPVANKKTGKKSFGCYNCGYIACHKVHLINHIKQHKNPKSVKQYRSNNKLNTCTHCNASFKTKFTLDDHTVRRHPNFMNSISRKIHLCKYCAFKTTIKSRLKYHMSKHPETGNCKLKVCKHCNATFISRFSLDDHIVRKHPTSVEDVISKIYECKYCTFKTIHKSSFSRHVFNHSETSSHECPHCTYKAMAKSSLTRHMHQYHATLDSCSKLKICKYCEATFKTDFARDDHVVRKHPDFIENVSRKIHECKHCTFKTTDKSGLTRHTMFKHPESADSRERIQCVHCTATFYTKQSFHEHTIQKHPDFAESVPSKIHRCAYCPYKTIRKLKIDTHMLEHPQASNVCHFSVCMHCSRKFKKEETLRAHILKKHTILTASD